MKRPHIILCILAGLLFIWTAWSFGQKILTIEDIYGNSSLSARTIRGVEWTPDGKSFSFYERDPDTRKLIIKHHALRSGKEKVILGPEAADVLGVEKFRKRFSLANYIWCPDGNHLLIPSRNDLFLYAIKTRMLKQTITFFT